LALKGGFDSKLLDCGDSGAGADWVTYLEAVATEDFEVARHYAKKLQVLDPDCVYPPGVFIEPAKKPGLTDENKPAKNEPL
jgi:hypothetical protein